MSRRINVEKLLKAYDKSRKHIKLLKFVITTLFICLILSIVQVITLSNQIDNQIKTTPDELPTLEKVTDLQLEEMELPPLPKILANEGSSRS